MSRMKQIIISFEDDFSFIGMEGDGITNKELVKVLNHIQLYKSDFSDEKHFHKEPDGLEWFCASYHIS